MESATTKLIITLLVGLVIGFFIGQGVAKRDLPSIEDAGLLGENDDSNVGAVGTIGNPTGDEETDSKAMGTNAVEINDQSAGSSVRVERAVLENASWIVVHADNNGAPAEILGAQLIIAGDHTGVRVDLTKPTIAGMKYHVMLHINDGLAGFAGNDTSMLGKDGKPISAMFTATGVAVSGTVTL